MSHPHEDIDDTPPFDFDGPAALRQPIERALRRVVDPELAMTIVDVGLVYAVTAAAERVHVVLTMTSAACPVTDVILEEARYELEEALPPGCAVELELVWEPAWTPERLSARARVFMGW